MCDAQTFWHGQSLVCCGMQQIIKVLKLVSCWTQNQINKNKKYNKKDVNQNHPNEKDTPPKAVH